MTGLFGGFLLIVTGYTRRMEGEVQQRTAELADANQQLQVQLDATRKAEANVSYLALHDSLTGLPNRPCWLNMARMPWKRPVSKASWRCCFWTWTNSRRQRQPGPSGG
jgi:PleD family two-component response regulator